MGRCVKSEMSDPEKRAMSMIESGLEQETKCVKRRRRSPSLVALMSYNEQQQQPPPPAFQLNSPTTRTTTTTTTTKRSSRFRGVSRHRWTGRYEAHLWDKGSWNATQKKKGKQVYLGAYDEEEAAARAYDLAAIKYWGTATYTNFPISDYDKEVELMQNVTREEYLASLRRRSSGFARGVSKYRGVARHHHNGRWEARIGRVFGNKYLYLGTYGTQEEAAHAYDIAAIEYRGVNAVTNFDLSTYIRWLRPGAATDNSAHVLTPENTILQSNANSTYMNLISNKAEHDFTNSFTPVTSFAIKNPATHEIIETKMPLTYPAGLGNNKKATSPTALGLLLQSSMFKELVEKNTIYTSNEENDGDEEKAHNGEGGVYHAYANELEKNVSPLCNRTGLDQSVWQAE